MNFKAVKSLIKAFTAIHDNVKWGCCHIIFEDFNLDDACLKAGISDLEHLIKQLETEGYSADDVDENQDKLIEIYLDPQKDVQIHRETIGFLNFLLTIDPVDREVDEDS